MNCIQIVFHRDSTAWPRTGRASLSCSTFASRGSQGSPSSGSFVQYLVVQDDGLCCKKGPVTFSYFTPMEQPRFSISEGCRWKTPSLGTSKEFKGQEGNMMMTRPELSATLHTYLDMSCLKLWVCVCVCVCVHTYLFVTPAFLPGEGD